MEQLEFNFRKDTFSKIFPFYILLDTNLCIKSYGNSIPKIIPELKKTLFKDNFSISRPHIEEYSTNQFNTIINQLVILKSNYKDETILRGQFEIIDEGYLFVGSPWFVSIEEVVQKNLSINDFAFHDSLLDILHVSKNYEINYNDLKELLKTVNEQRNILKKDKEELNKLSLVAIANKNGVVIFDTKGIISWCNDAYLNIVGLPLNKIIGSSIHDFEPNKRYNPKEIESILNEFEKGVIFNNEKTTISPDGKKIWFKTIKQPVRDANGKILNYFAIIEDVTSEKEKEELLLKLEKQNESLNDYAHMISHDLKSPLRSIHTLISWIKEEKDMLFTENGKKYMDMLIEKVEKMDNLIDGVLTISKLDTIEYKYQEVDLNEILNIVISIIHIPSHVTIKITNKFPTIYTDKYRIQQLFQNLISNAVNYSNKKAGKVTITYKDIDDFHLFSIKDNGIGIEKSYHEKIFDIFESYSDDSKSSGIGLSIVKKIIENYKGEIWLESELNKGTTFYFKIPKVNNGTT